MMHQMHKIQFDSFSIVPKILQNLFEFYIWHLIFSFHYRSAQNSTWFVQFPLLSHLSSFWRPYTILMVELTIQLITLY